MLCYIILWTIDGKDHQTYTNTLTVTIASSSYAMFAVFAEFLCCLPSLPSMRACQPAVRASPPACLRPISMLSLSLLRIFDSNFPGNALWT